MAGEVNQAQAVLNYNWGHRLAGAHQVYYWRTGIGFGVQSVIIENKNDDSERVVYRGMRGGFLLGMTVMSRNWGGLEID